MGDRVTSKPIISVKDKLKASIKKTANALGVDIQYLSKVPRHNALGLRSMGIRAVIDVGANTGQFARYIRSVLPEAKVICFEPLPEPFEELKTWAMDQKGRVTALNIALGEKEGVVEMFQHTDHSPSSSLLHSTSVSHSYYPFTERETPVTVRLSTLDKSLTESGIDIDPGVLIKLDVQGYEDRVIRGAPLTFASTKACLTEIDFDTLYDGQCTFRDVWKLLDDLGYRYAGNFDQTYAADGHVIFADALFVRDVK